MRTPTSTLFLALLVMSALPAEARRPMPRTVEGRVVAVDGEHQRFTLRAAGDSTELTLAWVSQTQFVRGIEFVSAASLKAGQTVTARYRTPLFTPRFANRIVIH